MSSPVTEQELEGCDIMKTCSTVATVKMEGAMYPVHVKLELSMASPPLLPVCKVRASNEGHAA